MTVQLAAEIDETIFVNSPKTKSYIYLNMDMFLKSCKKMFDSEDFYEILGLTRGSAINEGRSHQVMLINSPLNKNFLLVKKKILQTGTSVPSR